MALLDLSTPSGKHDLHVDSFGLSVGAVSVGLPMSCTTDTVLLRYLALLDLVDPGTVEQADLDAHLSVLADVLSQDPAAVQRRLDLLAA